MITNIVTPAMLQVAMQNTIKKYHAVGDVIMRWNERDPALDYGGNWERTAQGRFPLGTGGGAFIRIRRRRSRAHIDNK